jgi:hypothetical protein
MHPLKALVAQLISLITAFLLVRLTHIAGLWPLIVTQAAGAALMSRALKQPAWWIPIHLSLAPAAAAMLSLQIPAWIYLLAALLLALVFWGTVKGDVPLFLSSSAVADALQNIVDREHAQSMIDLGAGIGSVTVPLAAHNPGMKIESWERAPIPWGITAWRSRRLSNATVIRQNLWTCDLSRFDVVFAFLSPAPMPQLGEKALREMRPGSLLVSSTFIIPGWEPESIVDLQDHMHTRLYCYRIK